MGAVLLGIPEFDAALAARMDNVRNATRTATHKAGLLLEKETKRRLTTYTHRKGEPTNSPPGQPPALVTGTGRRSIKTEGSTYDAAGLITVRVGPTARYMRIQELGGKCGRGRLTTLPARPYLAPALAHVRDSGQLQAEFVAAWRDAWTRLTGASGG